MKFRLFTVLCLFFLPCLTVLPADQSPYGKVELLRDEWGVPHIFADTDEGAMYGLGYAAAEDRAFQMTFALRTIQGRTSEVLGAVPVAKGDSVDFDKKMRYMGFYRGAQEVASNLDPESIQLLEAYSQGVNRYFDTHTDKLVDSFEKLNIKPEPWTPADCIASWWQLAKFFAGDGLRDTMVYHGNQDGSRAKQFAEMREIRDSVLSNEDRSANQRPTAEGDRGGRGTATAAQPPLSSEMPRDEAASVVQREDVTQEWIDQLNAYAEEHGMGPKPLNQEEGPKFSHAWVVGGSKTTTGSAVLCSDPQTPVRNPSLLYEFHIQGKTFNARGIGVPGSPVILIGWNENVAWGMTALGADQADQFFLQTDAEHPDQYFFDGEWRDMKVIKETIVVKGGENVELTVRETHFGPVVSAIAFSVRPGEEVALKRIPMCEKDRDTIQGAVAMMRSKNVQEYRQAVHGWRFPSANTVFGDKEGGIGYMTIAAIPLRSPLDTENGNVTFPGTESKYDWQGFVPYDLLPQVINPKQGFLLSGNHRPIASFYPLSIGISTGSMGDTDRSWRIRERLQAKNQFTPEDVLAVHYDSVNASRRELVHLGLHLRDVQKVILPEEAFNTLNYLNDWYKNGASSDLSNPGAELATLIPTQFRLMQTPLTAVYGGGQSGLCFFLKTMQKRIADNPQAEFNDLEQEYIVNTLSQAWRAAVQQFHGEPEEWNEQARRQVEKRQLVYQSTLDGFALRNTEMDINFPALTCVDGGTIKSQAAQSYSQWVPLHDVDSARSILPIGQSENPDSRFRLSTYELWGKGEMHSAPITRKAVDAVAVEKVALSSNK